MTKIYEDNKDTLVRPNENQFVRIKSGLYQGDIGYVYNYQRDENIWIKLLPRVDPNPKVAKNERKISFIKFPQVPFNPKSEIFSDYKKDTVDNLKGKTYYRIKSMYFKKGFLNKSFNIK